MEKKGHWTLNHLPTVIKKKYLKNCFFFFLLFLIFGGHVSIRTSNSPEVKCKNEYALIWPVESKLSAVESWFQETALWKQGVCFEDGQRLRKKETGKSNVLQTGEFPKQLSFPFEKKMSLGGGCSCSAKKQDEAQLLQNPYFTSGKPLEPRWSAPTRDSCPSCPHHRGPPAFPPSWHSALPSQPGLLCQVLRQIAQVVAMRSVSSQEIPADGALSILCYHHQLNTSYLHHFSHPVYTALPHSAQRCVVVATIAQRYVLVWLPECFPPLSESSSLDTMLHKICVIVLPNPCRGFSLWAMGSSWFSLCSTSL